MLYALHITQFSEGSLPIYYLGLPLISGTLKAQHCNLLISKFTRKINLWTCKFISQAGRIQLIRSVLFGILGFWIMYIFLPSAFIKKIQSIFAKFLWKGSISGTCLHKIAWVKCCYSKSEGGLGFKNLHKWNEAAILFQLWRIVTKASSIWVRWIHSYELLKKSFWTLNIPSKCTWGWRKILSLRPLAMQKISYRVGRDSNFLLWHDPWCNNKPLMEQFDYGLRSALESDSLDPVGYIQVDGQWDLGTSNYHAVRELRMLCSHITPRGSDEILWNDLRNVKISISSIYNDIAAHKSPPPWLSIVWSPYAVPKFAITTWLILQHRLLTKDRMLRFLMNTNPVCVLCAVEDETHSHLFSSCPYTRIVLAACSAMVHPNWTDFSNGRFLAQDYSRLETNVAYLFITTAFYAIWKERNNRIFKNASCNPSGLINSIRTKVREKLYSCQDFRRQVQADQDAILLLY